MQYAANEKMATYTNAVNSPTVLRDVAKELLTFDHICLSYVNLNKIIQSLHWKFKFTLIKVQVLNNFSLRCFFIAFNAT